MYKLVGDVGEIVASSSPTTLEIKSGGLNKVGGLYKLEVLIIKKYP